MSSGLGDGGQGGTKEKRWLCGADWAPDKPKGRQMHRAGHPVCLCGAASLYSHTSMCQDHPEAYVLKSP